MFDPSYFLKSITIGIAVAAPAGPMSLLCMQRTLRGGSAQGIAFGTGIAAADCSYAGIGAFGLAAVSSWLLAGSDWLRIGGALVLFYFAFRIIRTHPDDTPHPDTDHTLWQGFVSAYLLTLANPPTILFFAGLFASMSSLPTAAHAAVFIVGIFIGSLAWWIALTAIITRTASQLTASVLVWINRITGLGLIGFAVYTLGSVNPPVLP